MPQPSRLQQHAREIQDRLERGETRQHIANALGVPVNTLKSYLYSLGTERPSTASARPIVGPNNEPVSELEMVKAELSEYRRAAAKTRKTDVQAERRQRAIEEALETVRPAPSKPVAPPPPPSDDAHHRHVLLLSDFHGGELVNREAVNGLNEYDWDIMLARVDQAIDAALSHRQHSPELTGLDVGFLGDMNSGSNHAELKETNQYVLAEQGVKMGYLQGDIVERLAQVYPNVRVFTVPGNHPRLQEKPAAKNVHDNMDWVSGVIGKEYCRHLPNVEWTNAMSNAMIWSPVDGVNVYVFHGDGTTTNMPGVPWGGILRKSNSIKGSYASHPTEPVRIDEFYLGHYHQLNAMHALGIYMNGALKGTDEWSLKKFGSAVPPAQLLLEYDAKRKRQTGVKLVTPTAGLD